MVDLLIRSCDQTDATAKIRYPTSFFLGHTSAEYLTSAFRKATEGIMQMKILQVSMDGPNINLATRKNLEHPTPIAIYWTLEAADSMVLPTCAEYVHLTGSVCF